MLRQDNALVFVRLELTPQPLGRFPDVAGEIVEFGLVESEGHGSIGGGKQETGRGAAGAVAREGRQTEW